MENKNNIRGNFKHGYSKSTKEYFVWKSMKQRCLNPNNKGYKNYGGRGVYICERWINSFENFLKDMGKRPSSKHSIERIKNDGNYEPDNCKWATKNNQANNCRSNILITKNGITKTIAQWSVKLGVNRYTLYERHDKGWSDEKILSPIKKYRLRTIKIGK